MNETAKLSEDEVTKRLSALDGWSLDDGKLYREFQFKDFVRAFGFMASVATVAQAMDHHPDWSNVYNTVRIHLMSHDVQGLSGRDFALATQISELAGEYAT